MEEQNTPEAIEQNPQTDIKKTSSLPKTGKVRSPIWVFVWLVLFFPIGLYLLWTKKDWTNKTKKYITVGWFILLIFGLISLASQGANSPSFSNPSVETQKPSTAKVLPPYAILNHEDKGSVENYYALIDPKNDNAAETIAKEIKTNCQKKCNISIYDDKEAYALDKQAMDNPLIETNSWDQQHYIFLADHTIGSMEFEENTYISYPYRDSTYETLKSGGQLPTPKPTLTPQQIIVNFEKDAQTVTVADIYKTPNSYSGKSLIFTCSVSGFPKDEKGDVGALNCDDPNDFTSNVQIGIGSTVDVTKINESDTIKVYGMGTGAIQGKNAYGGDITTGGVIGLYIDDLTTGYSSYNK